LLVVVAASLCRGALAMLLPDARRHSAVATTDRGSPLQQFGNLHGIQRGAFEQLIA
jgi:hypothetical protein